MGKIRQRVLRAAVAAAMLLPVAAESGKFFPDDPIWSLPPPLPIKSVRTRNLDPIVDFFLNSAKPDPRPPTPAGEVNTLGEVPDSSWFTNRHAKHRMNTSELRRGAGTDNNPVPPFTVVSGKTEGITPGFRMRDSFGRLYFVKSDPLTNPEMATGAELIVSKFLWAIGYNTPEDYIVYARLTDFHLSHNATTNARNGSPRKMTWRDFKNIVDTIPHYSDGSFRFLASLSVPGEPIGPFRFDGTRSDDPNDIVPHENRRDLRGLFVVAAWLNHTDAKANNSLDTIVENEGSRYIKHYLIDFGSALGSDGDRAKDARFGHEFMLPRPSEALKKMSALGLISPRWERANYSHLDGVGRLEAKVFEPDQWKTDYPNPAFLSRLPDDEYWGAKQVMAFSDDDIRTIVDLGQYSDPRVADYLVATLQERRDKIGRTCFSKVLPLDRFAVENGELHFEDLAVAHGFRPAERYSIRWSQFNNSSGEHQDLADEQSTRLPQEAALAPAGAYFAAVFRSMKPNSPTATVYIRKQEGSFEVVGIERTWLTTQ